MEVKKSMNRFVSILFIVAMGVSMFAGIHSSAPDMRYTSDVYFDETNLMDIRVIGTMGLTEDDMEALRQIEGVQTVEPGYMTDVLCTEAERQTVLHIEALLNTINQVSVTEGGLPEKGGECFLDQEYMKEWGYQIGDYIDVILPDEDEEETEAETAEAETEEETEEEDGPILRTTRFKIVGSGHSSTYVSYGRGSSSVGSGEVSGFMYILPEDFDSEVYTVAYLTVEGASEAVTYTDEYTRLVESVLEQAEEIQNVRCEIRYREVVEEAQATLDEHKADLAEGESELEDARKELEDGKKEAESELTKAKEDLESGESELEDGKQQLKEKEQELADAKQQIADGEAEIAEQEAKLKDGWAQLTDGETQLSSAEKQLKQKQSEYDSQAASAQEKLDSGQKELDAAKAQIEAGLAQIESEGQKLDAAAQQSSEAAATLQASQAEYDAGAAALAAAEQSYAANKAQLDAAWAEYNANADSFAQQKQSYETGLANLEALKSQQSAASAEAEAQWAAAADLRTENSKLQDDITSLNSEISSKTSLISSLEQDKTALESKLAEYEQERKAEQDKDEDARDQGKIEELDKKIEDVKKQIREKEQAISDANNSIASAQTVISEKNDTIKNNSAAISAAEQTAQVKEAEAAGLSSAIAELSGTLEASAPAITAGEQQLAAAKAQLDANTAELEAGRTELDTQTAALAAAKAQLDAGWAELAAGEEQIAAGRQQLEASKQELEAGQQEIEANQKTIDDSKAELASGKSQLDAAWKEINSNKSKLASSRAQLESGQTQLNEGKQTLADSKAEISDGEQQIADAWDEIAENEQKIKDGWEEYEEGKKEAESEIQDGEDKIKEAESELEEARAKLEDAQKEIDELEEPEWYVNDREVNPEYSGYGENAERIRNIGKVFPVLFFLVAALISLTTMTRMVEEQRTQIGTLKALGYSKLSIASKYMKYALYATLGGSIAGVLIGEKIFPYIIVWAYGMMYPNLRSPVIPYNWEYGLMATGAALVCTLGATLSACYKELAATPAVLMRPPAPKEGKRVLLERIPFIWKHLNFTWKSTIRNLFRYKKRFFMTIIGIGGCMGLLLVGFGLKDSVVGIGDLQYDELQTYDMLVILDEKRSQEEQAELTEYLSKEKERAAGKNLFVQMISVTDGKKEYNPYLYVPEDMEDLGSFLVFRDRISHETYQLGEEGAIVTEKLASMLGVEVGDELIITDDDKGKLSVPIAYITENYLSHYVYLTPALYEQVYGEKAESNAMLLSVTSEEEEAMETIGGQLLNMDGVLNVTYSDNIAQQLADQLASLDLIIGVLIICAGMLAFVVLYNLNNININERKRELATLKVLGFHDSEVAAYVYRENILLTVIGAAVGIGIGGFLHRFIILTVEVDNCMFGRNIYTLSFVYGTLFTFAFSAIVNWFMYFKLKKIDMVESLKSVE